MAVSYGAGAALTLDEFALWLDLSPQAYWSREGRISIDAIIVFGALLSVGIWGTPFFRGLKAMWNTGMPLGEEVDRLSTFRRVRLLRPRKARQSGRRNGRRSNGA